MPRGGGRLGRRVVCRRCAGGYCMGLLPRRACHGVGRHEQGTGRLEIRGTAKGQRRLIDLKPGEIRSVKLEIIYNQDRSQVTDSDQK